MEIWKDIKGYENSYQISNCGRVMSKERNIQRIDKRGYSYSYKRRGKILKNIEHENGYSKVTIHNNSTYRKQVNVHRIVAEHFIENPHNKAQVNHIDGNKHNPRVENLEWATPSENSIHAYDTGLSNAIRLYGKDNNRSRKVIQILDDGTRKIWDCASDAVREFGFDSGGITNCCQGKYKTHHGFKWEYYED